MAADSTGGRSRAIIHPGLSLRITESIRVWFAIEELKGVDGEKILVVQLKLLVIEQQPEIAQAVHTKVMVAFWTNQQVFLQLAPVYGLGAVGALLPLAFGNLDLVAGIGQNTGLLALKPAH